jgi:hypothetical protein
MLRAALTISRKSPEKFKLGFKQIIRPLVMYGHVPAPAQPVGPPARRQQAYKN